MRVSLRLNLSLNLVSSIGVVKLAPNGIFTKGETSEFRNGLKAQLIGFGAPKPILKDDCLLMKQFKKTLYFTYSPTKEPVTLPSR